MPETAESTITIILATGNRDKVKELRPLLENISPLFRVTTLKELEVEVDIEETEPTLEGNALLKARAIFSMLSERFPSMIALADDTGLEVDALEGAPGVYSARYAPTPDGIAPTYQENVRHLLHCMKGITDRNARFRTVIALKGSIPPGNKQFKFEHLFGKLRPARRKPLADHAVQLFKGPKGYAFIIMILFPYDRPQLTDHCAKRSCERNEIPLHHRFDAKRLLQKGLAQHSYRKDDEETAKNRPHPKPQDDRERRRQ